ncbi:MAG: hypothetical protein K6A28_03725, partial [Bacteroidales bacterium]|nr:hypothetical protein [Bacteroidales bacterium]
MKRTLLLLLLALAYSASYAEHDQTLSQELPSGQSLHLTATDHIQLSPGFKSSPMGGHEVLLEIDAFEVTPPSSGIVGGPNTGDDGVVGALNGVIDISALGGATYSIPVMLPKGLGEMSPQLSIYYNNQQRNGLLGWNWDLSGISSITRIGKNLYHDGQVGTVDYTDDRFCLDGQRLFQVSGGSYGDNEMNYRTEQDQMNKIVSYTESGFNGPSHFTVWTADGKIMHYGNSEDS